MLNSELPPNWDEFINSKRLNLRLAPEQSSVFGLYFCKQYAFNFLTWTKPKVFAKVRADNGVDSSINKFSIMIFDAELEIDIDNNKFDGNFGKMIDTIYRKLNPVNSKEANQLKYHEKRKDRAEEIFIWLQKEHEKWVENKSVKPYADDQRKKVADLNSKLLNLNYKQQASYRTFIEDTNAGTVLLRAKDERIQRWLVYRLFQQTADIDRAMQLILKAPEICFPSNDFFLWAEIARKLDLPDISKTIELKGEANEKCLTSIQDKIAQRVRTQPFILVLFEARHIQFESLMDRFWVPLMSKVKNSDHHCLLILCEEPDYEPPESFLISQSTQFLPLAPLEKLEEKHVKRWIKTPSVKDLLGNESEGNHLLERCKDKNITSRLILSLICHSFGLKSLAELEQSWEVAL